MVSVVVHTNPTLANQVETAEWLRQGFAKHGIDAEVTRDQYKRADVQVVQGPWYCYRYWLERCEDHRVLWLNRTFYGHPRWVISLGWLRPDGSRDFRNTGVTVSKGILPELKRTKDGRRSACVFADYGRDPRETVTELRQRWNGSLYFRPHPQQPVETKAITLNGPLSEVWEICDLAIGHSTTALIEARINGLHIECSDPANVVNGCPDDSQQWLRELSWCQWNHKELMAGTFWDHLHDC